MSLYGMMRTGISGMQGQSSLLATVADNIANSATTGYKRVGVEFSTLLVSSAPNSHNSGGIVTNVKQSITQQGVLQFTDSALDLAVDGSGFFVVQDAEGNSFMTRAGSFVPDAEGRLVNAAGYFLAGFDYANGQPAAVANGLQGLDPVQLTISELTAIPSENGVFHVNLPSTADAVVAPATLPTSNSPTAEFTQKTSLVAYTNLGEERLLDVYMTKTGPNTWEMAVFDQADATAGTSFPYAAGPLATQAMTFDGTTGDLTAGGSIVIPVPDGQNLTLDMSRTTQLATDYTVADVEVDGNAPAAISGISIGADGVVTARFANDTLQPLFRIPLADVPSPDLLTMLSGNLFAANGESGDVRVDFPGQGGNGSVVSGALEASTVDIATELTNMIQAQRNYTANSKVFQTGSELMDVLLTLKR